MQSRQTARRQTLRQGSAAAGCVHGAVGRHEAADAPTRTDAPPPPAAAARMQQAGGPAPGAEAAPNAGALCPNAGALEAPKGLAAVAPNPPNAGLAPKAGVAPKAGALDAPNAGWLCCPKAGVAPKAGAGDAPNAGWLCRWGAHRGAGIHDRSWAARIMQGHGHAAPTAVGSSVPGQRRQSWWRRRTGRCSARRRASAGQRARARWPQRGWSSPQSLRHERGVACLSWGGERGAGGPLACLGQSARTCGSGLWACSRPPAPAMG